MSKTKSLLVANPALLLDNQLCFALYSTSLAMTKLYQPLLKALGLTYPQYLVMLVLWESDGISVSELGERLFLDSGTLTPLLKRLQHAGLLQRQRSAVDERRVQIVLSPAGQALREQAKLVPQRVLKAVDCPLPELIDLTRQMQQLRSKLLA